MSDIAVQFDHVGKLYKLGLVGTGTLSHDLNRWWKTAVLHKEDPYLKIGETNDRSKRGHSDYVWALKDITFDVHEGDVVGIIGKNGAGKSTLLKLLSRVTSPTTGTIRARGRIASLLEVGTGFHPEMTGRENIYMNGSIMGMTRHEISRKLDEIVDFAGVERYVDTPVKRYSSGMTVRLGFAVAAFLEPEILVVDEVLAVGDAEFQKKAIGKMQDVSRGEGRTVLFVSHNMAAVRSLCTSGIVLKNGMMDFSGEIDDVIQYYLNENTESVSSVDIGDIPRGKGCTGALKFTGIDFLDRRNKPTSPRCGDFLRVMLAYHVGASTINDCQLAIGIANSFGAPMITAPSNMVLDQQEQTEGDHVAYCDFEKLPLSGGVYKLSLWAGDNYSTFDFLDKVINMPVADDDYYGNGKLIVRHLKGKVVLCDYNWSMNK